ncbi:HD-GYP domain-containing protein [Neobacillus cucumis]|uniref:HD-GYP domain-containing protein n=1 Tax=Neobacillus cucumis TaxID=1740721 RepID=UPI002E1D4AE6|nr:HD-GYP domain-containing protein [Neobacillus cucumis]
MKKQIIDRNIINQETRTLKWFLVLFFIIAISVDILFNFISQYIPQLKGDTPGKLIYWVYIFMFALIPLAHYLIKKQKPHYIKFIYFISYTSLYFLNEVVTYIDNPKLYSGGNVIEMFWILLSPIFVSKLFVITVSVGLTLKYIIVGIIIKSPVALLGIVMVALLSVISFILLFRFQAYVSAVKTSYDQQLTGLVKGVIATLELKDPYTRGHSERVASYAYELAKVTGKLNEKELNSFNFACLLHDIGKIHIPDQILMKPTRLTAEEYEIIKSHTTIGADAVSRVVGLNSGIEVIRSHHERWDGKGYPDQLKGEEIPFLARVASIADAFDAMTSNRSYRNALSIEEAYKRILESKGTQFDPELVSYFQKAFPKWKEIHDEYK